MNIFRVVIIISVVLFSNCVDASSKPIRRSSSCPAIHQTEYTPAKEESFVCNAPLIFSQKEFSSALAQRRLDWQLSLRLGRSKSR